MTEKHTPGPWSPGKLTMSATGWASLRSRDLDIVRRGPDVIAAVWCGDDEDGEEAANARLIAAAPDMFDALPDLSHVISWLRNGCDPTKAATELEIYQRAIDAARAKAKGRS